MKLIKIIFPIFLILFSRIDLDSQEINQDRVELCKLKLNNKISLEYLTKLFDIDSNCYLFYISSELNNKVIISKELNSKLRIEYWFGIDDKDTIIFQNPFYGETIKNLKPELIQSVYKIKSDQIFCIFADSIFDSYFSK